MCCDASWSCPVRSTGDEAVAAVDTILAPLCAASCSCTCLQVPLSKLQSSIAWRLAKYRASKCNATVSLLTVDGSATSQMSEQPLAMGRAVAHTMYKSIAICYLAALSAARAEVAAHEVKSLPGWDGEMPSRCAASCKRDSDDAMYPESGVARSRGLSQSMAGQNPGKCRPRSACALLTGSTGSCCVASVTDAADGTSKMSCLLAALHQADVPETQPTYNTASKCTRQ